MLRVVPITIVLCWSIFRVGYPHYRHLIYLYYCWILILLSVFQLTYGVVFLILDIITSPFPYLGPFTWEWIWEMFCMHFCHIFRFVFMINKWIMTRLCSWLMVLFDRFSKVVHFSYLLKVCYHICFPCLFSSLFWNVEGDCF